MALINCPECKKEISDKCKKCPNCGYPLKRNDNNKIIIFIVIGIIVVIGTIAFIVLNNKNDDKKHIVVTENTTTIKENTTEIIETETKIDEEYAKNNLNKVYSMITDMEKCVEEAGDDLNDNWYDLNTSDLVESLFDRDSDEIWSLSDEEDEIYEKHWENVDRAELLKDDIKRKLDFIETLEHKEYKEKLNEAYIQVTSFFEFIKVMPLSYSKLEYRETYNSYMEKSKEKITAAESCK